MTEGVFRFADGPGNGPHWTPVVREEATRVLTRLPAKEREAGAASAVDILGRCVPPSGAGENTTGLVVGYIQSGKTLSFTTVAALAHDNDFPIIVLIAGTTDLLLSQSRDRLRDDLGLERDDAYNYWVTFESPTLTDERRLEAVLSDWRNPDLRRDERATALVTVMKNRAQLTKLTELLRRLELESVPVLVIDDEADQASLNTRWRQGEESATYRAISTLRSALPRHSFLQYTATPQAPLLLSLADLLSPDFCVVLEPGADYIGGKNFFVDAGPHVRTITDEAAEELDEPPAQFLEALRFFWLAAAVNQTSASPQPCLSMMIHPSRNLDPQGKFQRWVHATQQLWSELLAGPEGDADRQALLHLFEEARSDLSQTVREVPELAQVLPRIRRLIAKTNTAAVNAARGTFSAIKWTDAPCWILVGGQLLDRGFTVKGLIVTYLSRPVGVGNADTLQQRARFYGYKRDYFDYCRVYVDAGTRDALESYVRHEEHMRSSLAEFSKTPKPLSGWRRAFLLDTSLQPTRSSVMSLPVQHAVFSNDWFRQSRPHANDDARKDNLELVTAYTTTLAWTTDPANRPRGRQHRRATTSLVELSRVFLSRYQVADSEDSVAYSGLLLQLAWFLEKNPDEAATVYLMRPGGDDSEAGNSKRSLTEADAVNQLFQGPDQKRPELVGDVDIHDENLTVQIHRLDLRRNGEIIVTDVPVIAVWVPSRLAAGWVIQR